jgi:tetratricopeptide (TPR) repeat protein
MTRYRYHRRSLNCHWLLLCLLLVVPSCTAQVGDPPLPETSQQSVNQVAAEVQAPATTEADISEVRTRADRLILSAVEHTKADRDQEAMADYQQALELLAQINDRMGSLILLVQMTTTERLAGNHPAAQSYAEQALSLLDEPELELSLDTLLVFCQALGIPCQELLGMDEVQLKPFLPLLQPLLRPVTKTVVLRELIESLIATGSCTSARVRLQEAQAEVDQIKVSVFGSLAARMAATAVQDLRAQLELACGSMPQSPKKPGSKERAENEQRLEKARAEGDQDAVLKLLAAKVELLHHHGDSEAAAVAQKDQIAMARTLDDRRKLVQALDNAGAYLLLWSRFQEALQYLDEAVTIHRQRGPSAEMAASLAYLGVVNARLGLHDTAAARLAEAREMAQKYKVPLPNLESPIRPGKEPGNLQNPFHLPEAMIHRALAEMQQGHFDEAEQLAQMTLELATAIGQIGPVAFAHIVLARVEWDRQQTMPAFAHLDQAREIAHSNGWRDMESAIMAQVGAWRCQQGETDTGIDLYRQAIDLYEEIQGDLQSPELLSRLIDQSGWVIYEGLIEILAAQGMAEEAFDYTERARARAFLNMVGNRRLIASGRGGNPKLLAEAEELRRRLGVEQHRRPADQKELAKVRAAFQEALLRVRISDPEYADLVQVGTIGLKHLQHEVLTPGTTLVAYFVTGKQVLAWVIGRHEQHMLSLELPGTELTDEVTGLTHQITSSTRGADLIECPEATEAERGVRRLGCLQHSSLASLYQHLMAPLSEHIATDTHRLIIVPHSVLHLVPFASLWSSEREHYLVEEYTLVYAPSASVLPHLRAKQTPDLGRALVLGDPELDDPDLPPLPHARSEAEIVADLLGTRPFLGTEATEALVFDRSGRLDWLHVAAHATYNQDSPAYSRIELTPDSTNDGHLEVHEVMTRLDLRGVNLVVLSACATALGDRSRGDEIVGLSRAFLYAGSPAVLTTLWPVDDEASAELMSTFYQGMSTGKGAAESLRNAQLHLSRHEQWRSPYYWAAFKLTGDTG